MKTPILDRLKKMFMTKVVVDNLGRFDIKLNKIIFLNAYIIILIKKLMLPNREK